MQKFLKFYLNRSVLERFGLPDIAYPVTSTDLNSCVGDEGELSLDTLLYGLQQKSREGGADWEQLEPAMETLSQLCPSEYTCDTALFIGEGVGSMEGTILSAL